MRRPDTIRQIPDPAARASSAMTATGQAQKLAVEYSSITRDAVRELRQTMSLGEVAKALGVSRTRIQQLEKG